MTDLGTFEEQNKKELLRVKHILESDVFGEEVPWFHMNEQYYIFHFRDISGKEIKKLQKRFKIHNIFKGDDTFELSIYLEREN